MANKTLTTAAQRFGVHPDVLLELWEQCGGKCQICGVRLHGKAFNARKSKDSERHAVDHCHATGSLRGILCGRCNTGLGFFRDKPSALRNAASFLEGHANAAGCNTLQADIDRLNRGSRLRPNSKAGKRQQALRAEERKAWTQGRFKFLNRALN